MAEVKTQETPTNQASSEHKEGHPFLSIGFRPFFLLATLLAVVWIPLWLHVLSGGLLATRLPVMTWHAHEMLFGFAGAVIAGFLLTAASNWTGRRTITGTPLLGLALLWISARVLLLLPTMPTWLVAAVDLAFFPAVAFVLARPMVATKNARNFPFLGMLGLLFLGNAFMHADVASGGASWALGLPWLGATIGMRTITLMMVVMGGRVIPMFTRNTTKASGIENNPRVDQAAIILFVVAAISAEIWPQSPGAAGLWLAAGGLHLLRMKSWGTRHARAPLLWILHFGYLSIALSFVFEGLSMLGVVPGASATHLLTVGGIGGLCLGMMTRVSLGHSGRTLVSPPTMAVAFFLLVGATLVRVVGPLLPSPLLLPGYLLSGTLWTGAFLFLLGFGIPIWFTPRADRR